MKIFILLILVTLSLPSFAANPTGSCGALIDITPKNIEPVAPGQSYGANILMLINFDTSQVTVSSNVAKFPSNYTTPSSSSVFPSYTTSLLGPVTFTLTSGPVENTFVITIPNMATIALLPVNSNKTFLMQIQNDRGTGVCQAL
jgi:hypothetical protein